MISASPGLPSSPASESWCTWGRAARSRGLVGPSSLVRGCATGAGWAFPTLGNLSPWFHTSLSGEKLGDELGEDLSSVLEILVQFAPVLDLSKGES